MQSSGDIRPATQPADIGYAGDISAAETWDRLQGDPEALLVDVRTDAEWTYVGAPDLSGIGKKPLLVAWQLFPAMAQNPDFLAQLRAAGATPQHKLYFICRSGARSRAAAKAATTAGFANSYNVAGGFEGDLDPARHRGRRSGWKASDLPWSQS